MGSIEYEMRERALRRAKSVRDGGLMTLDYLKMTDETLELVVKHLQSDKAIISLLLDCNHISNLTYVTEILRLFHSIKSIYLTCNRITDITPFVKSLHHYDSLRTLHLGSNPIKDLGSIIELLKLNHPLENLSLMRTGVSDKEIPSIAESLRYNNALKSLYLGYNEITNIAPLVEALSCNSTLEELYLFENQIQLVKPIASTAPSPSNMSLRTLNLWGNKISDVSPLIEILSSNIAIVDLQIYDNPISSDQSSLSFIESILSTHRANLPKRRTTLFEIMIGELSLLE